MSCFIVSSKHINAMVSFVEHDNYFTGSKSPDDLVKILTEANIKSYNYRYDGEVPIPTHIKYVRPKKKYSPIEIIKACDCYDSQSCEFPEWGDSHAMIISDTIRALAIARLPGYEEAEWEIG